VVAGARGVCIFEEIKYYLAVEAHLFCRMLYSGDKALIYLCLYGILGL
jgi:hypothetical protein